MTKVLMLGWEFPPQFSGGLGVATYGIVKALSPTTSIRLIIPTASDELQLQGVSVTGLNRLTLEESWTGKIEGIKNLRLSKINLRLSPYHHINVSISRSEQGSGDQFQNKEKQVKEYVHRIFNETSIYGSEIQEKVALYTLLAEELAADGDFDVIHAHDWLTFTAGINIKTRTGKPLLLHIHALETDRSGESTRNEIFQLEKKAFASADKVIAVSHYTSHQLTSLYDVDASKIEVIHNGIDTPANFVIRKEKVLRDKLVVFLGRLTHQKGPQFLLETAEKVIRVYPRVKFVVAGSGDLFAGMIETVAYKKMGRYFIFTGFLNKPRVDELLAMADVYFMPSVSEPFGLAALEAAQHEVPSIVSSQTGAHEVMPSGLAADFWDTDKYANYIFALLKYGALREEMISRAKTELKTLTWDHTAIKLSRLYNMFSN